MGPPLGPPLGPLRGVEGPEYHTAERSSSPAWHVSGLLVSMLQKGDVAKWGRGLLPRKPGTGRTVLQIVLQGDTPIKHSSLSSKRSELAYR